MNILYNYKPIAMKFSQRHSDGLSY